jgi:hypothetical protein
MPTKYFYNESPFVPEIDEICILDKSLDHLKDGFTPTLAICTALHNSMHSHFKYNIIPYETYIAKIFKTNSKNLLDLLFGYEHVFDLLILSSLPRFNKLGEENIKVHFGNNPQEATVRYISLLQKHMVSTRKLISADESGLSTLDYLDMHPLYPGDYFDSGHEMANFAYKNSLRNLSGKMKFDTQKQ